MATPKGALAEPPRRADKSGLDFDAIRCAAKAVEIRKQPSQPQHHVVKRRETHGGDPSDLPHLARSVLNIEEEEDNEAAQEIYETLTLSPQPQP